jgi:uncharacterized protein
MSKLRKQGVIIVTNAKGGGYYFKIVAENGRTLCHSEVYKRKATCLNGVKALKECIMHDELEVIVR